MPRRASSGRSRRSLRATAWWWRRRRAPPASASRSCRTAATRSLPRAQARFARWPASAKIFLHADSSALRPGETLVQSDLADTLTAIAEHGPRAFYEGAIADKIAAAVRAAGGLMTGDDLKSYRP